MYAALVIQTDKSVRVVIARLRGEEARGSLGQIAVFGIDLRGLQQGLMGCKGGALQILVIPHRGIVAGHVAPVFADGAARRLQEASVPDAEEIPPVAHLDGQRITHAVIFIGEKTDIRDQQVAHRFVVRHVSLVGAEVPVVVEAPVARHESGPPEHQVFRIAARARERGVGDERIGRRDGLPDRRLEADTEGNGLIAIDMAQHVESISLVVAHIGQPDIVAQGQVAVMVQREVLRVARRREEFQPLGRPGRAADLGEGIRMQDERYPGHLDAQQVARLVSRGLEKIEVATRQGIQTLRIDDIIVDAFDLLPLDAERLGAEGFILRTERRRRTEQQNDGDKEPPETVEALFREHSLQRYAKIVVNLPETLQNLPTMKKILSSILWTAVILLIGLAIYKGVTRESAVKKLWNKYERVVDINRQAPVGATLTCPICDTTFVKANPEQVFCSPECRKKYERLEKGVRTEGKIEDELLDLWNGIKTRVKRVTADD